MMVMRKMKLIWFNFINENQNKKFIIKTSKIFYELWRINETQNGINFLSYGITKWSRYALVFW